MPKPRLATAVGLSLLLLPLGVAPAIAAAAATTAAPVATQKATPAKARTGRRAEESSGVVEPAALRALQRMSGFLGTLTSFEVTSENSRDLVTGDGQRLTLDGVASYKVRRPDGFVIDVKSDVKNRTFIYDGKTFTVYAPELGFYATVAAPPTIRRRSTASTRSSESRCRWRTSSGGTTPPITATTYLQSGVCGWNVDDRWRRDRPLRLPRRRHRLADLDSARRRSAATQDGDHRPLRPGPPAYTAVMDWNVSPTLAADDFAFSPAKTRSPSV